MQAFKSKMLHVVAVLLLAFVPLAISFNPVDLYVFIGSVLFAVSVAVVHAYWPSFMLAVNQTMHDMEPVDWLTLAIVAGFLFIGAREAYITFYREFFPAGVGRPDDYYLPLAFVRYGAICAGFAALAAISKKHRLPGWPRAITAMTLGAALGLVLVQMHP